MRHLSRRRFITLGDKRKLEDAASDETKKGIFKGLADKDFADLAAHYASLK